MPELTLFTPSLEHKIEALLFRDECLSSDGTIHGGGGLGNRPIYEEWLAHLHKMKSEETVPSGLMPSDTYFAADSETGTIIGIIDIRHRLNEKLALRGGNIGYCIRPSQRERGFAPLMLSLALERCAALGLRRVLITCDNANLPSARTAMRCGGVEEFTEASVREGFRRFWIAIEQKVSHVEA